MGAADVALGKSPCAALCALQAGFSQGEVQVYAGSADRHPRDYRGGRLGRACGPSIAGRTSIPADSGVDWLDFGAEIKTRAVRLILTKITDEGHPHTKGNTKDGKARLAGRADGDGAVLGSESPSRNSVLKPAEAEHPPIPIRFTLKEPGVSSPW